MHKCAGHGKTAQVAREEAGFQLPEAAMTLERASMTIKEVPHL